MKFDGFAKVGPWMALLLLASCGGDSGSGNTALEVAALTPCPTVLAPAASSLVARRFDAAEPVTWVNLSSCPDATTRDVVIGPGTKCGANVLIDQSLTGPSALGKITILPGGILAMPTTTNGALWEIKTKGVSVAGTMSIGTAQCPVGHSNRNDKVRFTFTGSGTNPPVSPPLTPTDVMAAMGSGSDKGIQVESGGVLRLYGAKGVALSKGVNWTYLAQPAGPKAYQDGAKGIQAPVASGGQISLHLATDVTTGDGGGWRADDWIVVATTSFSPFESEFVQIAKDPTPDGHGGSTVELKQPLRHYHFGGPDPGLPSSANYVATAATNYGVDERAEVGLVSRSITMTSETPTGPADDATLHWGGEIRIMAGFGEASIQGVELEKFGKARIGSYPIHFHMDGNVGNRELIDSNSIHHSYNKCVTVHMSQGVSVTNNVCARAIGHLFYQELGQEQGGKFTGNLGIGAMSNNFGIAAGYGQNYWEGDYLAESNGYNGLNVPDTDNQTNPSRGKCFGPDKNAPGRLISVRVVNNVLQDSPAPCDPVKYPGEFYVEQSSGFWIGNPGTILEGNSIAGCQGMGKAYWYVPPAGTLAPSEEVGSFNNNRAHGCFDGLFGETDQAAVGMNQLFPIKGGLPKVDSQNLVAHFKGFTATRIRNRGVWMRPAWIAVENSRFATNRDSVSLVSSGGLDGNTPGVWALLKDSVLVGLSTNNVDRWGPAACPPTNGNDGFGCVDYNPLANELFDKGYQSPRWNTNGYMIYDGPVRIIHDHFVNYLKDITPLLTSDDKDILAAYTWPVRAGQPTPTKYEGDAALGWFQANQSAYPTATVTKALSWDNVDLRHQIFTDKVNLDTFRDGDKNTAVIDLDGSLTGYKIVDANGNPIPDEYPISLNNLEFNRTANSVDECGSTGQQDAELEDRPTSIISPGNMASLNIDAGFPSYPAPGQAGPNWQDMVFTKDSLDGNKHQSMVLNSRNGQGMWEPKVANGSGYSVYNQTTTAAGVGKPATGMPPRVDVGLTDAVKSNMAADPFHVRVGICFTSTAGMVSGNNITVQRGYRSWGGGVIETSAASLVRPYYNKLDNRLGDGETCMNLNAQVKEDWGYGGAKGCPAQGATPVPAGGGTCPAGSTISSDGKDCVYPKEFLTRAGSIGELTKADGTPTADAYSKYYFDQTTGMLYFYAVQKTPNATGPSPVTTCGSGADSDEACPGVDSNGHHEELDTYYSCPPEGCSNYTVLLNEPGYVPGPAMCEARAPGGSLYGADGKSGFYMPEPTIANRLAYFDQTGLESIVKVGDPVISSKGYVHWVPAGRAPTCPKGAAGSDNVASVASPLHVEAVVAVGTDTRSLVEKAVDWLRDSVASLWQDARSSRIAQWLQDSVAALVHRDERQEIAQLTRGSAQASADLLMASMQVCSARQPLTALVEAQVLATPVP